ELGKTAGTVLLACAVFAPRADRWHRLAWAIAGATQLAAAWWLWPSANTFAFGYGNVGAGVGLLHAWRELPAGIARLAAALTGWKPLIPPALTIAGALALYWAGPARGVLSVAWVTQLGFVLFLAAAGPDLLRARRFEVVEGLSIAAVLAAGRVAPV